MYQLELLSLVFFEYSNYHRTYFEYSNCIYNIKLPVRVYCPNRPSTKIWNEDTLNILNPIEASLNIPSAYMSLSCFSDFIKQNWSVGIFSLRILTEVTLNIPTTTVASWNIPTEYLTLSCEPEFILTEVTWNIPTTIDAS